MDAFMVQCLVVDRHPLTDKQYPEEVNRLEPLEGDEVIVYDFHGKLYDVVLFIAYFAINISLQHNSIHASYSQSGNPCIVPSVSSFPRH